MGELGWTEREALMTTLDSIWLALEGRQAMLRAIFGEGDAPPNTTAVADQGRKMSPMFFDALFGKGRDQ